jgi:hypothetical protein
MAASSSRMMGCGLRPQAITARRVIVRGVTVEDDGVFTIPRSATMTSQRAAGQWPEFVCAEKIRAYYYRKDSEVAGTRPRKDQLHGGQLLVRPAPLLSAGREPRVASYQLLVARPIHPSRVGPHRARSHPTLGNP